MSNCVKKCGLLVLIIVLEVYRGGIFVANYLDEEKYLNKDHKPASRGCLVVVIILMIIFGALIYYKEGASLIMLIPVFFVVVALFYLIVQRGKNFKKSQPGEKSDINNN